MCLVIIGASGLLHPPNLLIKKGESNMFLLWHTLAILSIMGLSGFSGYLYGKKSSYPAFSNKRKK